MAKEKTVKIINKNSIVYAPVEEIPPSYFVCCSMKYVKTEKIGLLNIKRIINKGTTISNKFFLTLI